MRLFALIVLLFAATPAEAQTNRVHQALDPYAHYQNDVSVLSDAEIASTEMLEAALARVARHDPSAVAGGWIAYEAMAAAQSPAFVRGVQSRVAAAGRAAVIRQLVRDITYARRRPPGDAEATQLIISAVEADTARMDLAAARYEAIGRTADMSGWAPAEDRTARHARLSGLRVSETLPDAMRARLHIAAGAASPLTDPRAFGGRSFWDALSARSAQLPTPRAAREALARRRRPHPHARRAYRRRRDAKRKRARRRIAYRPRHSLLPLAATIAAPAMRCLRECAERRRPLPRPPRARRAERMLRGADGAVNLTAF